MKYLAKRITLTSPATHADGISFQFTAAKAPWIKVSAHLVGDASLSGDVELSFNSSQSYTLSVTNADDVSDTRPLLFDVITDHNYFGCSLDLVSGSLSGSVYADVYVETDPEHQFLQVNDQGGLSMCLTDL
jgi:hypothetical protein